MSIKTAFISAFIFFVFTNSVTAQCNIFNITTTPQECDSNGEYYFELDFEYTDVGTSGFHVFNTFNFYTAQVYQYADLPVLIGPIPGFCENYMDLEVYDIDNENCSEGIVPMLQCCENQFTILSNLEATVDCNEDETFEVTVNFDDEESSSLGYVISVRPYPQTGISYNFGPFPFSGSNSQTVSVPEIANCQEGYKIVVYDALELVYGPDAMISTDIDVCCQPLECNIFGMDFGPNPICDNNQIVSEWFIFAENTSESGFDVFVNNQFLTFLEFDGEGPYDLDIPNPETEFFTLQVCDNDHPDCCYSYEWENPCYEPIVDCEITQFEVIGDLQCSEPDVAFGTWAINGLGLSEVGYDVYLEDNFLWTMNYEEDGEYEMEFQVENNFWFVVTICDSENPECCVIAEFMTPCFVQDCNIEITDINLIECQTDGGLISLGQFTLNNSGAGQAFNLYVDGQLIDDNIPYSSAATYGVEFPCDEVGSVFTLTICDSQNLDCCFDMILDNPCEGNCNPECLLFDMTAEVTTCEEELFDVLINLNYTGTTGTFSLAGNGVIYGSFNYDDLPVTITGLDADCETEYEFIATDNQDNDCQRDVLLGQVCCPVPECNIFGMDFGPNPICDNNQIVSEWFIFAENTSESGFDVFVNNQFLTFLEFDGEGPYDLDIPNPETEFFTLQVCDNDNPDCCYAFDWENPCYEPMVDCELSNLEIQDVGCDDIGYLIYLTISDLDHIGASNYFRFFINGVEPYPNTSYQYDDNFNHTFEFNCSLVVDDSFEVTICDSENEDCCISTVVDNPCFESCGIDCVISDMTAVLIVCEENIFDVQIDFQTNSTGQTFSLIGNGVSYGTFNYSNLPITLTELESDCVSTFEFIAIDDQTEVCSGEVGLGVVCCDEGECNIFGMDFGPNPICENNQIVSEWFIFAENTSESGFDVFVNNQFLTFLEFDGEGPYDLDIPNPETEFFTLQVCDNDHPDCCYSYEWENPCYEPIVDCEFTVFELQDNTLGCLSGGNLAFGTFTIEGVGQSNVDFDISVNGIYQFSVNYNPNNIYNLEFEVGTELETVVIQVCDGENENCCQELEFANPCFELDLTFGSGSVSMSADGNQFYIDFLVNTSIINCLHNLFIDDILVENIDPETESFRLGPFDCNSNNEVIVGVENTCTGSVYEFVIDLGNYECQPTSTVADYLYDLMITPTQSAILFDNKEDQEFILKIYTVDGKLQNEALIPRSVSIIDLSNYAKGILIGSITDKDNRFVKTLKLPLLR